MDYKIKKMAGFKVIGFSRVWSGDEPANAHEKAIVDNNIEWYGDGDPSASDYHAAIWIPVKKK